MQRGEIPVTAVPSPNNKRGDTGGEDDSGR